MGDEKTREPRGFGEHTRGLTGEYAHEQGWDLEQEERSRQAATPQDIDGGKNYNYGAENFGDEPVNMDRITEGAEGSEESARQALGLKTKKETR